LAIQLKERAGKEVLGRRFAWREQVSSSAKILSGLYPILVHGVCINRVNTTDQAAAARDLEF
jgi:hypothetical protein